MDKNSNKSSVSESFFDKFEEVKWNKPNHSKSNKSKPQLKKKKKSVPDPIFVPEPKFASDSLKNGQITSVNWKQSSTNSTFRNFCTLEDIEQFNPALGIQLRNESIRSNNFQEVDKLNLPQINTTNHSVKENAKNSFRRKEVPCKHGRWMRSVSESETSTLCETLNELKMLEQNHIPFTENDDYLTNSAGSTGVCSQTDISQDESDNVTAILLNEDLQKIKPSEPNCSKKIAGSTGVCSQTDTSQDESDNVTAILLNSDLQKIKPSEPHCSKKMKGEKKRYFLQSNFEDELFSIKTAYKLHAKNYTISKKRSISQPSYTRSKLANGGSPYQNDVFSSPGIRNKICKKSRRKSKAEDKFEGLIGLEEAVRGLDEKTLIKGELRINPKNYTEAYITHPEDRQDVLIIGVADRNRALDGDIVVVQIKDEDKWRKQQNGNVHKTGKVVHILELFHKRSIIGFVQKYDDNFALVKPRDCRLPRLLVAVATLPDQLRNSIEEYTDVYYKAQIVCWNTPKFALGLIVCKIGKKGEISAEIEAILRELDLDSAPVPESLNKYLPPLPFSISQQEIDSRLDLRNATIFSIDPETARDLDDAVSIRKLSSDTYEVGVHISDVSYFLQEGTPLDEKVSDRATTIYMVDRVNHMLPLQLCLLCSLLPGEDKLAFSVIWEMNKQGSIINTKFTRSVIHSCAQLSYGHAQDIMDGKETLNLPRLYNGKTEKDIRESILALYSISKHLTAKRFASGALRIDQPKIAFKLDNDCLPYEASLYVLKDSNRLIEEFMLLANQSVAEFIHKKYPKVALLRRHPPPKEDMISRLETSLNKLGIFIETRTSGDLHNSLLKYTHDDPARAIVLNCLCSKAMCRALYYCCEPDTHHYALNIDMYTHFTSPIRRYVDIVVHRVLAAALGYSPLPSWDTNTVREYARNSNVKKYAAKRAGEASSDLYTALYIKKLGFLETEAVVFNISSHSFDAIISSLALKIRVYIDDLQDVEIEHKENDIASSLHIRWKQLAYTQIVQLFSEVRLLLKTQETSLQIEAQLLPPSVLSYTSDSSSSYHSTMADITPFG